MAPLPRVFRITAFNLRKNLFSAQVITIAFLIATFLLHNLEPVAIFSSYVGIKVTPYAFPHLINDFICQLIMVAGSIALFWNAPYEDESYMYVICRSGKTCWALGQILYILSVSLIYVTFLLFCSVVPLAGHLEIGSEWGKIWGTLAKTDAGADFGQMFFVTEYLQNKYSPGAALLYSFFLEWGCISWIGLLIYCLNKAFSGPVGTVVGAFFVLLDICVSNDWMPWARLFSPVSLAQLNTYSGYNLKYHVTFSYGICFFVIGGILLSVGCVLVNHKKKIKILTMRRKNGQSKSYDFS